MRSALALLASSLLVAAAPESAACAGDSCAAKDEAALLQHRGKSGGRSSGVPTKGMAFEGGGFKAHAAYTGVMSAILHAATPAGDEPDLKQLLKNIKVISSNSGGSWFMSQLAFSPSFLSMVEIISHSPSKGHNQYLWNWIVPFFGALVGEGASAEALVSQPMHPTNWTQTGPMHEVNNDRIHMKPIEGSIIDGFLNILELLWEIVYLTSHPDSWQAIVSILLTSTSGGDMTGKETLGSKVNDWAQDKWWLVATSLSSPGGSGPGTCNSWLDGELRACLHELPFVGYTPQAVLYGNSSETTWSYKLDTKPTQPAAASWTPARFSAVLGAGESAAAPMKFCEEFCDGLKFDYMAGGKTATSAAEDDFPYFATAQTSLLDAVSASSAFAGEFVVFDQSLEHFLGDIVDSVAALISQDFANKLQTFLSGLLSGLSVWGARAQNGVEAFAKADATLQAIRESNGQPRNVTPAVVAERGLFSLVDGGLSDNTAIGHALAAGVTEVICIQDGLENIWNLMAGEPSSANLFNIPAVGRFDIGKHVDTCPFCYAHFQLFEETTAEAKSWWQAHSTQLLLFNVSALNSVGVGSMKLTTHYNKYFGIKGGETVTLHVVNVNSSLFIGGFDYQDYPKLVQEVLDVMLTPANAKAMETILDWL